MIGASSPRRRELTVVTYFAFRVLAGCIRVGPIDVDLRGLVGARFRSPSFSPPAETGGTRPSSKRRWLLRSTLSCRWRSYFESPSFSPSLDSTPTTEACSPSWLSEESSSSTNDADFDERLAAGD